MTDLMTVFLTNQITVHHLGRSMYNLDLPLVSVVLFILEFFHIFFRWSSLHCMFRLLVGCKYVCGNACETT